MCEGQRALFSFILSQRLFLYCSWVKYSKKGKHAHARVTSLSACGTAWVRGYGLFALSTQEKSQGHSTPATHS